MLVCGDTLFLDEQENPIASVLADHLVGCTVDLRDSKLVQLYQPTGTVAAVYAGQGSDKPGARVNPGRIRRPRRPSKQGNGIRAETGWNSTIRTGRKYGSSAAVLPEIQGR